MRKTITCVSALMLLIGIATHSEEIHPNWKLATENLDILKISAYVPAREVSMYLGTEEGIDHRFGKGFIVFEVQDGHLKVFAMSRFAGSPLLGSSAG